MVFLIVANFGYSQTEHFESGIPASWLVKGRQGGTETVFANNWVHTAAGGYLGTGGATVNPSLNNTQNTTAEYFMITSQYITPANGEIRFMTKQGSFSNRGTTYQVRISTGNQADLTSYNVTLASWTEAQLNVSATTYEEKIVSLGAVGAGIPVNIAFVAITNQLGTTATIGDTWFVDRVRVMSSCDPVATPTIVPGIDGASISWTHPTATSFGVEVVPAGAGHGATGIPVTGTTYNPTGLNPATSYDFYIIANCDSETSSAWAGPFSFTTSVVGLTCPSAIVIPPDVITTPYTLITNLDQYYDGTTYVPMNSQGMSCQPANQTQNLLLGNHLYLTYTPTASGLINITQTTNTASGGGGNNCYNALSSVFVFDGCAGVGTSAGCLAALYTTNPNTPYQIPNFYAQAGQTYIFVISSPYQHTNPGAGICFTFSISGSTCPSPTQPSLSISDLLQTTATASWDNVQNLVSAWEYLVLPATDPAPTAAQSGIATNTNVNNPISSLTPGMDYKLYVRSVCNGTPGSWSAPRTFTTLCNPLPLPYYTGFNNATSSVNTPEPCWTSLNLNNDERFFWFGPNAFSEPVAKLRVSESTNNNDMLVTPTFHFDGVTQKRLRFRYNFYGNWGLIVNNPTGGPGSFEIRMSTTGVGPNTFTTTVVPLAQYTTAYNFIEMIVPLPNIEADVNIAWVVPPGALQAGSWLYIDDVYIEDLPACSEPAYPVVTPGTLDTDSVEISWTNGYANTQWQLVAQPLGTGVPTEPFVPGAVVNIVNTNPFTITGLNPSTQYEFYMRAYCSASEQSIWVGPINFNTLCIEQPTPYYESYNSNDPNTKKFCWSVNNANGDPAKWIIGTTDANIRPQPITFFDPFVSYNDWLISVPVNAVGLKRLRFNYRVTAGIGPIALYPRGNFEVLMSSTPDFATYTTLIPLHDFTNDSFQEDSVLFTGTGTTYIAFRMPPNMPNPAQTGLVTIDDFVIEDAPACPNPDIAGLTAENITQTTANLSWTPGYTETQWEVVVQAPMSGVPTGSGVTVNNTPTYQVTSLTQDTPYEYYVRAVCSDTESSVWVGPFLFRTICDALPTPFLETFDTTSPTETCWTVYNNVADDNTWNLNQTVQPMFGNQMAALFTGTNGNNNDWLITPTLSAHAGQRLRFYYKTYSNFFEEDLKVMLSVNGVATNQFTTILYENNFTTTIDAAGTTAGSSTITVADGSGVRVGDTFYIPGFPIPYATTVTNVVGNTITVSEAATITMAGPLHIVFTHEVINNTETREMVINLDQITTDSNINIAFHTPFFPPNPWNYRGQYTFIDNVIVEDIPACPEVINVTTSDILDVSAQINWETTGTETAWEISVQPYGTPAPVGDTLPAYLYTANAHPYTVTGLTPSTLYQYYIRAICSDSSESIWVGPFEILTRCDFTTVCLYTMSVTNGSTGTVTDNVTVMQNGTVVQALEFPTFGQPAVLDYQVYLCSGVEFSLYWNGFGSGLQYSQAQIVIRDESNNVVWTSPLGLGTVNTTLFTSVASCGVVTCPQPTNLAVSNQGVFSWTPGGSETQWEVFVQPYQNGTIPQSGTIVNTPSYTPVAADFMNAADGTYEYLVRAVCGSTNKSYWSGPKVFIRNDEPANAVRLQVNTGSTCDVSGADASFITATASTVPTSCPGVNSGDIWYDFVATSKVHVVELSDFAPGTYYTGGYVGAWPQIMMSLYEVQGDGSLVEKGCSNNNSFVAKYTSELVVGNTYKIRLTLNDPGITNKTFHICVTTPEDLCDMDAFNYSFEKLPMQTVSGISTILNSRVIPGWRTNTDWGTMFFLEGNNIGVIPYEGGQCVQLTQDGTDAWDPNDPNIKGLYKDFDTSEITVMDYSFASGTRQNSTTGTTVQLFAGPPSGPFTVIAEHNANSTDWELVQGSYNIPSGQTTTRFIFRTLGNNIGHILDAANFKANVDITINTADTTLDCTTTAMAFNANGVGMWEADANNPATTTIANPNSGSTNVSGFTAPGSYVFYWKSRYCDKTITITKQGTNETTQVVSPVVYCVNDIATPLTATAASGHTVNWYTQAVGGTGTTVAPTPSTVSAGNSQVYYAAAVDSNGCEGPRAQVVVQVNDLPTATISGTTTICEGTTAVITFNGTPNAVVTYTVNGGSNQTITLDATGVATLTTAALTANASYDLVSVTSTGTNPCSQVQTGNALITVESLPTATISGTTSICSGATTTITFNGTPNATVTYSVDGGANQTIVLNASGIATITTPALTVDSTYSLVSVTASGTLACSQVQTGLATITINTLPTAAISGTTSICSGATAVITFSGTPNAVVSYTVDGGTNQTITLDATGNATLTTPALTANSTYDLVSVVSGTTTCSQTVSGSATITVGALPTATITGTTAVCQNAANSTITFTGANGAEPYTFTYTINGGANQTLTTTTGNSVSISVPTTTVGVFTYTLVSVSSAGLTSCSQTQSGSAVVTVEALPTAAISGTSTICEGSTATISFNGTPNATVTYTVNGGANQTIVLDASGTATITTAALTATATYTLVSVTASGTTACSQTVSGSAVVTVVSLPTATISGTTTVCQNATGTNITFTGVGGAQPYTFTYNVNGGTSQTITTTSGNSVSVNVPTATVGVFTYQLLSVSSATLSSCSQTQSGTAIVTVETLPTVTISGTTSVCSGSTATVTFNGTPNATVSYTVNGGANQTTVLDASGNASITTSALTATTTYTLVDVTASGTSSCSQVVTDSAVITITPELIFAIGDSCQNSMLTLDVIDANFNTDTVSYTWMQGTTIVGTNGSFNVDEYMAQNPSMVLPITFSVTIGLNGCDTTQSFTVENNPCRVIPRGISPNNDQLNDTFDLTGYGVKDIIIFNRYGTKVFSFSGNYTNQWKGQSDGGDELPDGTYFYSIHTSEGANKTGWVYINRQY
ncbi:T9SS type B sorting domain-containing protein [Flavobacterium sp. IMCC34852]|uniref:T9SS type B sorting domain-containing protein n=1 Tax=Flavobacterium rivulicola TaxID=2732161 RepID=A0A7Y3RB29_9FLAO|nr:choice-of-anchor J domain-containing protein [Flavobacterium sp. IMCC34852]NNT73227.1 T9SS type B sorting domain-containing protein [Flavobacterium sp. IMCC34852]